MGGMVEGREAVTANRVVPVAALPHGDRTMRCAIDEHRGPVSGRRVDALPRPHDSHACVTERWVPSSNSNPPAGDVKLHHRLRGRIIHMNDADEPIHDFRAVLSAVSATAALSAERASMSASSSETRPSSLAGAAGEGPSRPPSGSASTKRCSRVMHGHSGSSLCVAPGPRSTPRLVRIRLGSRSGAGHERRTVTAGPVLDLPSEVYNPGLQDGSERCVMRACTLGLVFAAPAVASACSSIQPAPPITRTAAPAPRTASMAVSGAARRCSTVAGMLRDGQRVCLPCGGATLSAPRRPMVCENGIFRAAGACVPAQECKSLSHRSHSLRSPPD